MNKLTTLAVITVLAFSGDTRADDRLDAILADPGRPAGHADRDRYRNPAQTLAFFGIRPDMTVIELLPGGGWYTEILAPYLKEEGRLIAAHFNLEREDIPGFYRDLRQGFIERFSDTDRFGQIEIIAFDPPHVSDLGEPGSADLVLTFRNVHGWKRADTFGQVLDAAHRVLKTGGVLGVVGHRLPEDRLVAADDYTGYVKQSWVVAMAESHGFRLAESSAINANPADTADHPEGVWSLPPSLRNVDEADRARYERIGESDRFTLKFVKR